MKVKIRSAILDDLEEILSIENQSINLETNKTLISAFKNPNFHLLVAEGIGDANKSAIIGFVEFSLAFDEGEIISIAVDERFRKQKVATNLLQIAFAQLLKLGAIKVFLDVKCSNGPAIALYASLSFKKLSVRKNYYKNADGTKEDALVLIKNLDND